MRFLGSDAYMPVTPADVMAAVHIDQSENPDSLANLISAAVDVVETGARRVIGAREVEFETPDLAFHRWWFPIAPILSVVRVTHLAEDGRETDLDRDAWRLARGYDEPQLVLMGRFAPGSFRVTARTGLEKGGPALRLRQAAILLAKEWYDAGTVIEGRVEAPALSFGVTRLIRQVRYTRPQEVAAWRRA